MTYQQEKAEATRQQVLQAALKVFHRKGYSATTLADVAAEAKLSRGAIYWNFANKQDLYVELVREYFKNNIHDLLLAHSSQIGDPVEALRDYMYSFNLNVVANADVRDFMELIRYKTEVKTLSEDVLAVQQKMDLLIKDALKSLIRRGREQALLRTDMDEATMVMAALSYLNGIESTWLFNPKIYPLNKARLRVLIDFFIESIKA